MNNRRFGLKNGSRNPAFGWKSLALLGSLLLVTAPAFAQQPEVPEPPPVESPASQTAPDALLPQIAAMVQSVTTKDARALSQALHISSGPESSSPGPPPNTLEPTGDLDGDGVPEMLLKWAVPVAPVGVEDVPPAPDSRPLWALYLLSWDGAHWNASRLVKGVDNYHSLPINLGPPTGRALAIVTLEGRSSTEYPVVLQVKGHAAKLLWDSQGEDSRYQPLLEGRVSFQSHAKAPALMRVVGRADPGVLQFARNGRRGFQARVTYHWDGAAFVPAKTDFTPNEDYTIYRFIAALHLRDFKSAYAVVVPDKFLTAAAPNLEAFRKFIQDNWPEFPDDQVFAAPEQAAGSGNEHDFVLSKPDRRYVYHPNFSRDGKFLLTGLSRTQESLPAEP